MKNIRILIPILGIVVALILTIVYAQSGTAFSPCQFQPRSLARASTEEIVDAAATYSCGFFEVKGTPSARLVRAAQVSDLQDLGLDPRTVCLKRPITLVVLEGEFVQSPRGQGVEKTYKYVLTLFDLEVGDALYLKASRNGGSFRDLLGDPSLPDDPLLVPKEMLQLSEPPGPSDPEPVIDDPCVDHPTSPTAAPPS